MKLKVAERVASEKLREEVERDHEMALLMNAEFDRKEEEERIAAERAKQERLAKEAKELADLAKLESLRKPKRRQSEKQQSVRKN